MALKRGYSNKSIAYNINEEMRNKNIPQKQAVAIALNTAEKAKKAVAPRQFKSGGSVKKDY